MAPTNAPHHPTPTSTAHRYRRPLDHWHYVAEHRANNRVRGPAIAAAQRLGLASSRTSYLQDQLHALQDRLHNLRPGTQSEVVFRLEDRCIQLEQELHSERVSLWRDLHPLLNEARDAAAERMRLAWLTELLRVIEGGNGRK